MSTVATEDSAPSVLRVLMNRMEGLVARTAEMQDLLRRGISRIDRVPSKEKIEKSPSGEDLAQVDPSYVAEFSGQLDKLARVLELMEEDMVHLDRLV